VQKKLAGRKSSRKRLATRKRYGKRFAGKRLNNMGQLAGSRKRFEGRKSCG